MPGWLSPDGTPATATEWLDLLDSVDDALRLAPPSPHFWRGLLYAFAIQATIAGALLLCGPCLKSGRSRRMWRVCERDDQGFVRPIFVAVVAIFTGAYAISSIIATWLVETDLAAGRLRGVTLACFGCLTCWIFHLAVAKSAALVYISMQFFKTTDTATVLGIPISSRGYNYGCMIGFVGAPLITILPISVVGFYLTKAAVAHGAFQITIQSLVTTPDTPDAGLAATAMLQLDQIRRDELTAWTTFRVLLSAAVVLFLVFLLGLAVLGSRITCGLWKVVRIYKTGVQHMRSLQRMKTVGTFAPAEVGKRATLLFAEANSHAALEEFAQRSQLVWLGDDTSSDDASDAPSPPQSFHGELREQLDEMNVQYRHALIYASVLTFDLVATAILTTMLLALCLFVAINPLQAPEKTRIADMMTYGGLMIPVAWGATIAVPMAMTFVWLVYYQRPKRIRNSGAHPHTESTTVPCPTPEPRPSQAEPGPSRYVLSSPPPAAASASSCTTRGRSSTANSRATAPPIRISFHSFADDASASSHASTLVPPVSPPSAIYKTHVSSKALELERQLALGEKEFLRMDRL